MKQPEKLDNCMKKVCDFVKPPTWQMKHVNIYFSKYINHKNFKPFKFQF